MFLKSGNIMKERSGANQFFIKKVTMRFQQIAEMASQFSHCITVRLYMMRKRHRIAKHPA